MFIILHNPLSRNKKSKRTTKKVVEHFKEKGVPFRLKSLLKIKDIEHYIKHAPEDIKILLLGGDGTINTFINKTYSLHITQDIYLTCEVTIPTSGASSRTVLPVRPSTT